MKERPILFSGEMVRALLAGRKTQTRRVVKADHDPKRWNGGQCHILSSGPVAWNVSGRVVECPYGRPGDRLWVRETHAMIHPAMLQHLDPDPDSPQWATLYRADGVSDEYLADYGVKWKPSIFCRRQHSRLTLEVVAVRVERLLSISEEDAVFEGVTWPDYDRDLESIVLPSGQAIGKAVIAYKELWESINGPGSWALNPWVWVIEFKLLGGAK